MIQFQCLWDSDKSAAFRPSVRPSVCLSVCLSAHRSVDKKTEMQPNAMTDQSSNQTKAVLMADLLFLQKLMRGALATTQPRVTPVTAHTVHCTLYGTSSVVPDKRI